MNLKKISVLIATLAVALAFTSISDTAPVEAAPAKLAAVRVEKFTDTTYLIGLKWDSTKVSSSALYHLNISVDGSSYKEVDSWAGGDGTSRFTVGTVTDNFPNAKNGFRGKAVISYEIGDRGSADSNSFSFTANPQDFNSIRWTN